MILLNSSLEPKRCIGLIFNNIIKKLTPKGLGLSYVGFNDFGQATVNEFYF